MTPRPSPPSFCNEKTTSEAQPWEIHIWEFPQGFRVQLDEGTTQELVERAAENVGGLEQLASILKVHVVTVYRYRNQMSFIPLSFLLKLYELAGDKFTLEEVEPHVVAYKGRQNAKPIRNPNLPLRESPDLFALMGHLIGDGGHSRGTAYYFNTNNALIRKFVNLLCGVFGKVPFHVFIDRRKAHWKERTGVLFGLTIVNLLRHLYQTDFRTFTARVPQRLFELPREYAAAFLRAFGDDEGCVTEGQIIIASANNQLMQDIYALVQAKFPELGEYIVFVETKRRNPKHHTLYRIRFRTGALPSYRALIGFDHSEKKQDLIRTLACRARGWIYRKPGATRRMLLNVLKSEPTTAKDLARRLEVGVQAIYYHLKKLTELGAVIQTEKAGWAQVYAITEKGCKLLEIPPIGLESEFSGVRKKLAILKTLALAGKGMNLAELTRQLGYKYNTIWVHLKTRQRARKSEKLGLLELGFVKRSGRGTRTYLHVYSLTQEGKRVLEELEIHFPELYIST